MSRHGFAHRRGNEGGDRNGRQAGLRRHPSRYTLDPARLGGPHPAQPPLCRCTCTAARRIAPILEIANRRRLAVVEDCAGMAPAIAARSGAGRAEPSVSIPETLGLWATAAPSSRRSRAGGARLRQYGWKERYISSTRGSSRLDGLRPPSCASS
jgi:hypothetical protein